MNKKILLFAALALPLPVLAENARNCSLPHPPSESAVTESDGAYLFFYPRELRKNYTGCQIMWDENGRILLNLVFRRGRLVRYEYADVEKPAESGICVYERGELIKGDGDICPDYADAIKGFRAVKEGANFRVPAERDPRARNSSNANAP